MGCSSDCFSATLVITEVSAALSILHRVGRISKRQHTIAFQRFMNESKLRYQFIPASNPLVIQAAHLAQQHPLKAYDALHLAAALVLKKRLDSTRANTPPMIGFR